MTPEGGNIIPQLRLLASTRCRWYRRLASILVVSFVAFVFLVQKDALSDADAADSGGGEVGGAAIEVLCSSSLASGVLTLPIGAGKEAAPDVEEKRALMNLQPGGSYMPRTCIPRERLVVLVPVRDRAEMLPVFLYHMHSFLQKQEKFYTIFVVEQAGDAPFNRASLLNAGALEALRRVEVDCFVLHDVDALPLVLQNDYSCAPRAVRQLLRARSDANFRPFYKRFMGGVVALSPQTLRVVNGLSNAYWGWGGEDDDMARRVRRAGLRHSLVPVSLGRYWHLPHHRQPRNKQRLNKMEPMKKKTMVNILRRLKGRSEDGLSSISYKVLSFSLLPTHTRLLVQLELKDGSRS